MAEGRTPITNENPIYRPVPVDETKKSRAGMPELPLTDRAGNFEEVELGYEEETGKDEANRCLNCGYCCECFQCVEACGADAVTLETHAQQPETIELKAGSVIFSTRFLSPLTPQSSRPTTTLNSLTSLLPWNLRGYSLHQARPWGILQGFPTTKSPKKLHGSNVLDPGI